MNNNYKQFTFVELPVSDFVKSREFYERIMGLTLSHLDEANQWCLYRIPGSQTGCALYHCPNLHDGSVPRQGNVRLAVQVVDLDKVLRSFSKQGIAVEPIRIHQEESFRISGFNDPDGNTWRLWEPILPKTQED